MPNVTVLGSNGGGGNEIWSLPYTASSNFVLAQSLADQISAGIIGGSLTSVQFSGSVPPVSTPSVLDIGGPSPVAVPGADVTLSSNYVGVVDNSSTAVTINGAAKALTVIGGEGGMTFNSGAGANGVGHGFVIAGGGDNVFNINAASVTGGGYTLDAGSGNNTITAASGNNTILGGSGSNYLDVSGDSNNYIGLRGNDTMVGGSGSGHDTVGVGLSDTNSKLIAFGQGWSGQLLFADTATVSGGADTIVGGGGSVTVWGGMHKDVVFGGTAGNNWIQAGTDPTSSVTGGGQGDRLFAGVDGGGVIQAGSGNETLVGAGRFGTPSGGSIAGTSFFASSITGGANIFAGSGADTISAGVGQEIFNGNAAGASDFFIFNHAVTSASQHNTGGPTNVTINDFTVGKDTVALVSYGYATNAQVASDVTQSGGNSFLTLTDGTKIEFTHVSSLTANNFKV